MVTIEMLRELRELIKKFLNNEVRVLRSAKELSELCSRFEYYVVERERKPFRETFYTAYKCTEGYVIEVETIKLYSPEPPETIYYLIEP